MCNLPYVFDIVDTRNRYIYFFHGRVKKYSKQIRKKNKV